MFGSIYSFKTDQQIHQHVAFILSGFSDARLHSYSFDHKNSSLLFPKLLHTFLRCIKKFCLTIDHHKNEWINFENIKHQHTSHGYHSSLVRPAALNFGLSESQTVPHASRFPEMSQGMQSVQYKKYM